MAYPSATGGISGIFVIAADAFVAIANAFVIIDQERCIMARETVYVVQAYTLGKRARLNADTPLRCKSPEAARKTAERLATTKAGVVAFSTSGDADLGEYDDEPAVFFKAGRLPIQFQDE